MTRVINLVAPSGVGKTTLARLLEEENDRYNVIQSFTTREAREENEYGHTFIKDYEIYLDAPIDGDKTGWVCEIYDKIRHKTYFQHNMIAYFNSYNSGHHYFATDEQVIRGKDNLYIVDPAGAEMVHEYYRKHNEAEKNYCMDTDIVEVITIYLYADKETRSVRMIERYLEYNNMNIDNPNNHMKALSTTAKRIEKDEDIFKNVKCDYFINANGSIEEVKEELKNILEG